MRYFADHKSLLIRCCLAGILILCGLSITTLSQENPLPSEPPVITRIAPATAAAETHVEIEGYRLGATLTEGVRVLFVQGTAEYMAVPGGSSYTHANLKHGPEKHDVIVPEQLQPGPCQVVVEVQGHRSASFTMQISPPATAPVLSSLEPRLPRPGEIVWINGAGFSDSDDIVLTDAEGEPHQFERSGSFGANAFSLELPEGLPAGEASLQVTERRSGANLSSNRLPVTIVR